MTADNIDLKFKAAQQYIFNVIHEKEYAPYPIRQMIYSKPASYWRSPASRKLATAIYDDAAPSPAELIHEERMGRTSLWYLRVFGCLPEGCILDKAPCTEYKVDD